jgi:2-phosphoglycerate kinase
MDEPRPRTWEVLLLGGASGVGKSAVSYPLARRFGVGITEVDDFQVLLEALTSPQQMPALHFWRVDPAFAQMTPDAIMTQSLEIGHLLAPGLEAVIGNHLEAGTPVVLEGDFIHPDLATRESFAGQPNRGRVRAVFLHEPDEPQYVANYLAREPGAGSQDKRARVSWLKDRWFKAEAERLGIPVVSARPWDTVLERVIAAAG